MYRLSLTTTQNFAAFKIFVARVDDRPELRVASPDRRALAFGGRLDPSWSYLAGFHESRLPSLALAKLTSFRGIKKGEN